VGTLANLQQFGVDHLYTISMEPTQWHIELNFVGGGSCSYAAFYSEGNWEYELQRAIFQEQVLNPEHVVESYEVVKYDPCVRVTVERHGKI
jgi:hypothetical protein